jgi:hypothetical protein
MFLKQLHLTNFRCFEDLELSFIREDGAVRKWTILLGENGTGKSCLLQAIALITSGTDALGDLLGEPNDWIMCNKRFCEISATLLTEDNHECKLKLHIGRNDNRSTVIIRNKEYLASLDHGIEEFPRHYFLAGYGPYRRINRKAGGLSSESKFYGKRARNVASLFDADAPLAPIESWAMDLDYLKNRAGLQIIRKTLNAFLPGLKFARIDKKQRRLMFSTPGGTIPLQFLSDGYQCIVCWIGDLLHRIMGSLQDYNKPLDTRGLLLIDELALHLHVGWQRNLIGSLNKYLPHFQLVVTTHSPVTAHQADKGELHHLTREDHEIRLHPFAGKPKNLLLHQLITADLFGLPSDESEELQSKKERYKGLTMKAHLSNREKESLKELKEDLSQTPFAARNNVIITQDHWNLIKKIRKELLEQ